MMNDSEKVYNQFKSDMILYDNGKNGMGAAFRYEALLGIFGFCLFFPVVCLAIWAAKVTGIEEGYLFWGFAVLLVISLFTWIPTVMVNIHRREALAGLKAKCLTPEGKEYWDEAGSKAEQQYKSDLRNIEIK